MVTIRKMEQGGRTYYYLEYPVKVNGRVRKYSRYIGKDIPEDIDHLKRQFQLEIIENRWEPLSLHARGVMIGRTDGMSREKIDQFYHETALHFTASTLKLAGSKLTELELKRLLDDKVIPGWRDTDDVKLAVVHYGIAKDVLLNSPELSLDLLAEWHWKLYREIKPSLAGVITGVHGAEAEYSGFDSVYREYREKFGGLMLAGLIHFVLFKRPQFQDGNGIIARLAMNCVLHASGFPILDIDYSERKRYENALERSLKFNDETEFLKWFFLKYKRKIAKFESPI
ncbi:MAG: hypothetical protein M1285_04455 [Candidatus Thermoplasmatota archaeon]|nr:hypothetical protein [Candidatus Thermoplasmatota archaeon]